MLEGASAMIFIKQQTYAFVYKWTELSTGKWYIGSRTRNGSHPNDGYICSSKIVKPLILENRDNWAREILCIGYPKDMRKLEDAYLVLLNAKHDPMSYNMSDGTFSTTGKEPWNKGLILEGEKYKGGRKNKGKQPRLGTTYSEESKKKMSLAKKGRPGPKQSEETKLKKSKANSGKRWVHNISLRERKYVSPGEINLLCCSGWTLGLGPRTL